MPNWEDLRRTHRFNRRTNKHVLSVDAELTQLFLSDTATNVVVAHHHAVD